MTPRTRTDLDSLSAYVPGKNFPGAIKLASNETTKGPLPSVVAAITEAAAGLNRYPDNGAQQLVAALEARLGVEPGWVGVGCGSTSICQELASATSAPGDEVLFAWRSFECYPIVAKVAGATPVQVPLTAEFEHDFDAMAAAVTERTRLIFVCNPNNPTGASIPPAKIEAFLAAVPSDVVVVLDEAYFEFNRDENGQPMPPEGGGISFVKSHPNVAVTRTFSKAFGLAGARLGYIIARPELQEQLSKVRVPFSVNSLAQAAALASLDAADELLARTGGVIAERDRVRAALQAVGYQIPPSWANYLYFPLGERSGEFAAAAAEAGLLLRAYGADGVRASVGDPDENDAFIAWAVSPAARELAGLGAEATIG